MDSNTWHGKVAKWFFNDESSINGLGEQLLVDGILFLVVLFISMIAYILVRRLVLSVVTKVVKASPNDWDDELLNSRVFRWISSLVPTAIVWKTAKQVFDPHAFGSDNAHSAIEGLGEIIEVSSQVLLIIWVFLALNSTLNVIERIYNRYDVSRKVPLTSFKQVISIILLVVSVIFIISTLVDQSPILIFSGLGAATAVLMLIFKDSILGLVAGVQLSANQMVAVGDWIEMPKFGADGEVTQVALTTVKVRNWDKTITTVPTYALISDSFKNWRGMSESGVRRIKRSLFFDMSSIDFLSQEAVEKVRNFSLLSHYLADKEEEISAWNQERKVSADDIVNARALTNIGTFRAYVVEYLKNHPNIDEKETILVRQLDSSKDGLPIEIYAFCNDNAWVSYEGIQSDIFDHLMAVTPQFGLRLYQSPSGHDFSKIMIAGE